jgi:hypothetical protein
MLTNNKSLYTQYNKSLNILTNNKPLRTLTEYNNKPLRTLTTVNSLCILIKNKSLNILTINL